MFRIPHFLKILLAAVFMCALTTVGAGVASAAPVTTTASSSAVVQAPNALSKPEINAMGAGTPFTIPAGEQPGALQAALTDSVQPRGAASVSAPTAKNLGGLNLNRYCKAKHGGTHTYAENRYPHTAYTWKCWRGNQINWWTPPKWWGPFSIDMNDACRHHYGKGAYAKTNKPSDPYSWRCYR